MGKIFWTEQLSIGIEVIDQQHSRIVEYINQLDDMRINGNPREEISWLIQNMVDYTLSHFTFEESLQEEAHYPFIDAHKKIHGLFAQRVAEYQARFEQGEDVSKALNSLLVTWLFNHIKRDDADYAETVRLYLQKQDIQQPDMLPQNKLAQIKKILFTPLF
jgi:hemerythrin